MWRRRISSLILALLLSISGAFGAEPMSDPPPVPSTAKKLNDGLWDFYFKLKRFKVEQNWDLSSRVYTGYVLRPLSIAADTIDIVKPYSNSTASASIGYRLSPSADLKLEKAWNVKSNEEIDSLFYNLRW